MTGIGKVIGRLYGYGYSYMTGIGKVTGRLYGYGYGYGYSYMTGIGKVIGHSHIRFIYGKYTDYIYDRSQPS